MIVVAGLLLVVLMTRDGPADRDNRRASCAEALTIVLREDRSIEDALRNSQVVLIGATEYDQATAFMIEGGCYAKQDNSAVGCPDASTIVLSKEVQGKDRSIENALRDREVVAISTNEYKQVEAFPPEGGCYVWDNSPDGCVEALTTVLVEDALIERAVGSGLGLVANTDQYRQAKEFLHERGCYSN